jgi:hypothetical protein
VPVAHFSGGRAEVVVGMEAAGGFGLGWGEGSLLLGGEEGVSSRSLRAVALVVGAIVGGGVGIGEGAPLRFLRILRTGRNDRQEVWDGRSRSNGRRGRVQSSYGGHLWPFESLG